MIIEFSGTADYWHNQCEEARRLGNYTEALLAARKALHLQDNYDNRMEYADLLAELHQPRWSASICLHGEEGDTLEERCDWLELMMDNSARGESLSSALFYHMQLMSLRHGEQATEEWGKSMLLQMSDLEGLGEDTESPLQFAEDIHARQNEKLYERIYQAFDNEDYDQVCRLWPDAHPDYDYYDEMLFMAGISMAKKGRQDLAARMLWRMFELTDHDARVLYYIDEMAGGMTDEEMQRSLQLVPIDDNAYNQSMAGVCAARHNLFDMAIDFATRAMQLAPAEPQYIMRLAAVYGRMGDAKEAHRLQRLLCDLYGDFLPEMVAQWEMPTRVDVHFPALPMQLYEYMWGLVSPAMGTDQFALRMQTDASFRQVVRFLLLDFDQDVRKKSALAKDVATWQTPDGIAFWRDILVEPKLHAMVQFNLLYALFDVVRRGKVRLTCGYVADAFQLRVPPSYDDFSPQMRRIYVYAFCEMVGNNKHSELRLSRLAEKLYLNLPEEYYQANIMGYALAQVGHMVDKDALDGVIESRGWDAELAMRYVDLVRQCTRNG